MIQQASHVVSANVIRFIFIRLILAWNKKRLINRDFYDLVTVYQS